MHVLRGKTLAIVSKNAWSLHNYRQNLIKAIASVGGSPFAMGADDQGYGPLLAKNGIRFEKISLPERGVAVVADLCLIYQLYRRFKAIRPEVVHTFTIRPVIYGTIAAKLAGIPVRICTITGLGHSFRPANPALRAIVKWLYRLALSHADRVVFQNHEDLDLFVREGLVAAGRSELMPGSGVDLDHFAFRPPSAGLGSRPIRLAMISRLIKDKGVMTFVDAAESALRRGVQAEFVLVGPRDDANPDALSPEEMCRLAASPVRWIGPVDDVRDTLAFADVVVLPSSYREGIPRSLLEAMAVGRPIITTDSPGCRDLVVPGRTGYLVEPRDAAGLADAFVQCARNADALALMGTYARQFVVEHFDEAIVISRTLALYEGLVARKGA